jgi:hypothetical protein
MAGTNHRRDLRGLPSGAIPRRPQFSCWLLIATTALSHGAMT